MDKLIQDLRFGMRTLLKKPGFTLVVILTIALGIGANTAIFSVVQGVMLSGLSYREPDRLVAVFGSNPGRDFFNSDTSMHDFIDWRDRNRSFSYMAAFDPGSVNLSTSGQAPRRIDYCQVSGDFFSALGVEPVIGRAIHREDDKPGRGDVVVLSNWFWQNYFAGDRTVTGRKVLLDGAPHIVIGVMPENVDFPSRQVALWKPIARTPESTGDRGGRWLNVIGRLREGISIDAAQSDLRRVAANLAAQYPDTNRGWTVDLINLQASQSEEFRPALIMLWSAVGLVLLIACANVGNLMLAKGFSREREIAIRAALGAGRQRIIRQLLTESLLLSTLGGMAGIFLGWWGIELLVTLIPYQFQNRVGIDRYVLGYSIGISLLTGVVFGLLPAIKASGVSLAGSLTDGRQSGATGSRSRSRRLLVVGEVAVTLILLVTALLLIRSFAEVSKVDTGFNPDRMLTARIAPPYAQPESGEADEAYFGRISAERRRMFEFYRQLVERISAIPEVEAAGVINRPPLAGNWWGLDLTKAGADARDESSRMFTLARVVDPGFFKALGVPLIQGRFLSDLDNNTSQKVAVINRVMADRYWPGENPVGQSVRFHERFDPVTIVGIVGDVRYSGIEAEPDPAFYVPFDQAVFGHFGDWGMTLIVRTKSEPLASVGTIRDIVADLDSKLPLYDVATMDQVVDETMQQRRSNLTLLGILAGLALMLALVGIYSVMSYAVNNRKQEFGVRLALGAKPRDISLMVIREALITSLAGIGLGLGATFAVMRYVSSQLYGVTEYDPVSLFLASIIMLLVSLLAGWLPARRATQTDPMTVLRYE